METMTTTKEKKNLSPINPPQSNETINNSPPISPIPISRSDPTNPYPTTFVQADISTFKQVVQMLTGSLESPKQVSSPKSQLDHQQQTKNFPIPPIKTTPTKQLQSNNSFKLYERRHHHQHHHHHNNNNNNNIKASLRINTLLPGFHVSGFSPRNKPDILSPSTLDFPSLTLSPVTPLNEDPVDKSSASLGNSSNSSPEEERAIAQKGFYFHPSTMSTPRDSEPQLLSLFPVTSPRVSESSS